LILLTIFYQASCILSTLNNNYDENFIKLNVFSIQDQVSLTDSWIQNWNNNSNN